MPLGEALKKLLHPENESLPEEEEEPELDDLAEEIGEIESVADMDIVAQIVDEKKKAVTAAGGMTEITPDEIDVEETQEISLEEAEELLPEDEEDIIDEEAEIIEDVEAEDGISEDESAKDFSKKDDQITGQMSLEDILSGWEGAPERDMEPEAEEIEDLLAEDEAQDREDLYDEDAEDLEDDVAEAEAEDLEDEEIEDQAGADTDNSSSEGEVTGDTMETKKTTAPILPPDIQRMIDEIEGVIPPEEEKPEKPAKRTLERKKEEPHENMGKVAESLRIDNDDFEEEEYFGDDELPEEEFFDEGEAFEEEEEYLDECDEFEE